ncbi:MAG: hypothetical protein ACRENG_23905 [bacterium]
MIRAAIGFRVKSGWATAVLLAGSIKSPRALDRRVVELCDPNIPESRQPFHSALGVHKAADEKVVTPLRKIVERCANRSVAKLIKGYRNGGHDLCGAGLIVGSEIDPTTIKNPHIRAHALEGRLFREVLEAALRSNGLDCLVIVERQIYTLATTRLRWPEDELKRFVAELGRTLSGPWRSDEKTAALAAWLTLASQPR